MQRFKKRKRLLLFSLWLNAVFIVVFVAGYEYYRFQRIWWEMEASHWAVAAGATECIADHDAGTTRYYRMVTLPPTDLHAESKFTGDREDGVEVWSWPWYSNLGEASRVSNEKYLEAYNGRMKNFVKGSTTRPAE